MKKITSAALLAIQLSWKTVLAMFLASVALQIFYAFQELMPGGVPLQATLGYEMLLSGDIGRTGRHWMSMLLGARHCSRAMGGDSGLETC